MNPRIVDYIQLHRATYTRDAIRAALVRDGFSEAEIDEAFRAMESGQLPPPARLSGRLWLYLIGLIVVLYGLTLVGFGLMPGGLFIVPILAVPLALAAGISVLVAVLNRSAALGVTSGVVTVFVVPVALWVVIAGSCLALTAPLLFTEPPPPARTGTMQIEIDPPMAFEGSGAAFCNIQPDDQGYNIYSEDLGTLDGMQVSVSIEVIAGIDAPGAPGEPGEPGPGSVAPNVSVTLLGGTGTEQPLGYVNSPESRVDFDVEGGGLSGTVEFEDLTPTAFEGPEGAPPDAEPISGTITWRCD